MNVTFWKFSKRINSTKTPTENGTVLNAVYLKDQTDINNPILSIHSVSMDSYNYAKIGSKYYFVDKIEAKINFMWSVTLKIDLLATYKEDIFATEAYALYSSSHYNKHLNDNRLAMDANIIRQSAYADVPGFPLFQGAAGYGTYGLTVIGYLYGELPSHGTATVTYFMSPTQMQKTVEALLQPTFIEWIQQYFNNPFDAIVECFWTPFDVSQFTTLSDATVRIAGAEINIDGGAISAKVSYRNPSQLTGFTLNIDIPWIYDDFRNLSDYTSMNLFLPIVGNTELDSNLFYGEDTLRIECVMDWSTGAIIYDIVKGDYPHQSVITRLSSNAKTVIPIGQMQSSFGKLAQTLISVGAGVAFSTMPHMQPAMITSFAGAGAVALRRHEILQNGSYQGSFLAPNIGPKKAVLTLTANDTSDNPDNIVAVLGRPTYKKVLIGDCTGYIQTTDVSVAIDGLYSESQSINNYLNGGVYIE